MIPEPDEQFRAENGAAEPYSVNAREDLRDGPERRAPLIARLRDIPNYYMGVSGIPCRCEICLMRLEAANELEQWTQWGVIEVAIRNPSVSEYMRHWEGRALKAEAELGIKP